MKKKSGRNSGHKIFEVDSVIWRTQTQYLNIFVESRLRSACQIILFIHSYKAKKAENVKIRVFGLGFGEGKKNMTQCEILLIY